MFKVPVDNIKDYFNYDPDRKADVKSLDQFSPRIGAGSRPRSTGQ